MQVEQEQEVARLRTLRLTPKQIARKLGLKVSEVNAIVRSQAEGTHQALVAAGELEAVKDCWVNAGMAQALLGKKRKKGLFNWSSAGDGGVEGLGAVLVVRQGRYNRLSVCNYLVDYWCLGVKDAWGPRQFKEADYQKMFKKIFSMFGGEPQSITLEQAQAMVFSAVDYADSLGLKPHRDFEKARSHLGEWDGQNRVECGRDGKPFYFCGPYDNSAKIIDTLNKTVGEGNYEYVIEAGGPDSFDLF